MRVVDQPEDGAVRRPDGRGHDPVADLARGHVDGRPGRDGLGDRLVHVVDTPVDERSVRGVGVRQQAELVPGDLESHVERLVEVGLDAQHLPPPVLRGVQVGGGVDGGPQAAQREGHGRSMPG